MSLKPPTPHFNLKDVLCRSTCFPPKYQLPACKKSALFDARPTFQVVPKIGNPLEPSNFTNKAGKLKKPPGELAGGIVGTKF